MMYRRAIFPSVCLGIGLMLFAAARYLGWPFSNIAWALPALGLAASLLTARAEVDGEGGRLALALGAALAFLAASIVGFAALWSVVAAAWGHAHEQSVQSSPFATVARLWDYAAFVWADAWWVICLWVLIAIAPLAAGFVLARLSLVPLFAPARDVEGGPWSQRWMTQREAGYLARQEGGLPLGRLKGKLLRFLPGPGWRGGHHMLIAGTRAGKGVSGVLPAIIDHCGGLVALDIKGELFAVTRRWRESLGRRVIVLNPFSVIEAARDRFNPLDYVRPEHLTRDASVIADGLVKPEPGDGSHFAEMARELIAGAIEVIVRKADPVDRNLNAVADLLLGGDTTLDALAAWRDNPDEVGRPAAQIAAAVLGAGDRERGGILTTVKKAFSWAASDRMRDFLETSDFNLDDILDDKLDLFIVIPLDQIGPQAVFLRLVINLVLGTVVRQSGTQNLAKPLLCILDEFARLGRMEKIIDIATVGAGSGIEAFFVTQNRGQLESVYGKDDAGTLLGSCATVRCFGLGRTDNATAQWVVDGLGDKTVQTHSRQRKGDTKGSESEQRTKLFTVDQILELPAGDMIALFPAKPPLRLQRIISHDDPAYRDKLDRNPTLRAK